MTRGTLMVAVGVVLGAGGLIAAQHNEKLDAVRTLAVRQIAEKLDGKESNATAVEVTPERGQVEVSHRHPGPEFRYVLEGEYEWAVDDHPAKIYKAGGTFQEPSGCLHRVSRNPSATGSTKVIAVVLHPRSEKNILTAADN
jgi:quercetin dioxygenase-like cupin family protein